MRLSPCTEQEPCETRSEPPPLPASRAVGSTPRAKISCLLALLGVRNAISPCLRVCSFLRVRTNQSTKIKGDKHIVNKAGTVKIQVRTQVRTGPKKKICGRDRRRTARRHLDRASSFAISNFPCARCEAHDAHAYT